MIGRWRSASQTAALGLLLVTPLLNYRDITCVQGWFQSLAIGSLWLVSPLEGLECILVAHTLYGPLLVGMVLPVLSAALLGTVFCSWICPVNTLQVWSDRLLAPWLARHRRDRHVPRTLQWYVLALELLLALVLGTPLFVFLSPPGLVGRELMMLVFFRTLAVEGALLLVILGLNLFTRRFFCRAFCPLRGLLALLGARRRLVVARVDEVGPGCRHCDEACPLGLAPSTGEGASVHCWNCGRCVDACSDGGLKLIWRRRGQPRREPCQEGELPVIRVDGPGEGG
ncbi:4Fe-4S binding protein [bacterium]|nr:4Fe-4S binding protein [bacterium]